MFKVLSFAAVSLLIGHLSFPSSHFSPHEIQLITKPLSALEIRIQMIRSAHQAIDLEYFIFDNDFSSRLILRELKKKIIHANNNGKKFRVRILLDGLDAIRDLSNYDLQEIIRNGIEVRLYNPGAINVNHRNHRKFLIIDGEQTLTGGRNISDSYFALNSTYNLDDTDLWIKGPVSKEILKSFNQFWNSNYSEQPKNPRPPHPKSAHFDRALKNHLNRIEKSSRLFEESEQDQIFYKKINAIALQELSQNAKFSINNIRFVTDLPGKKSSSRLLSQAIMKRMDEVDHSIFIEASYWIMLKKDRELINRLLNKNIQIQVLTNSHLSIFLQSLSILTRQQAQPYILNGLQAYAYSGCAPKDLNTLPERSEIVNNSKWEFHSKTALFDEKSSMISTYNFDPRSEIFNAEAAVFIEDSQKLAELLQHEIKLRIQNSFVINKYGKLILQNNVIPCEHVLNDNGDITKPKFSARVLSPFLKFFKKLF